jgi:phage terminase large subunit-like protein
MKFDFSSYKPSARETDQLDAETDLFRGNKWIPRGSDTDKIGRYRAFLKDIRDRQGPKKAHRYARKIAAKDLYYLSHQVLGFKDLYEPFHGDLCKFLEVCDDGGFSSLTEAARSHFKSSIATTARSIRWMIKDQNVTIGLGSATLKDVRPFGKDIRGLLEKCEPLKLLFPDRFWAEPKKQAEKWTEEAFSIKRDGHHRENTVELFGLEDDMPTGRHYRKLLIDDAITKENVGTPERILKIQANAEMMNPIKVALEDPIHWVGTPYHAHDYYARLEKMLGIKVYCRPAMERGMPVFPTRFTKAKLEELRVDHGNYLFDTQYMMQRMDPSDKKFKREWIKRAPHIKPGTPGFNFFLCVDPASARRKESDFTAMAVFAVDHEFNFYWVDGVHDKLDPLQRIEAVFELARKWNIVYCSYETIGFQKTDAFYINMKMREDNFYFPIWEVAHHKENKDERIMGIQPIMKAGQFFIPDAPMPYERKWVNPDDGFSRTVDLIEQFFIEADFYPMSTHDDILDVFSQARSIVFAGMIPKPPVPKKFTVQTAYGKPVKKDDYDPMKH